MKTPGTVVRDLDARLARRWHENTDDSASDGWPLQIPLGQPTKSILESDFSSAREWALNWRTWAHDRKLNLRWESRVVKGTRQEFPTHLEIPDVDTAAKLVGNEWATRIHTGRQRYERLRQVFPHIAGPAMVRRVAALTDVDFDLLCIAASWFAMNDASGLTARQVPIEGLHGKWLNTNLSLIRDLANKTDLGLVERPGTVHFTYLDPRHRSLGRRRHDSITIGDIEDLAYTPTIVLVSENKDTALFFSELDQAIAVQGAGFEGIRTLARIEWLRNCGRTLYWGDIDASGYEIVNGLRQSGLEVETILMTSQAFNEYEKFGTNSDKRGQPIGCPPRKSLPHLTDDERIVYHRLTDPQWAGFRRIEQERIPFAAALRAVSRSASAKTSPGSAIRTGG